MRYGGRLLGWKAWYVGGLTFTSRTTTFQALPAEGVLGFVEFYANGRGMRGNVMIGRRRLDGGDWYYWDPEYQCIEYVPSGEWGTWQLEPKVADCLSCVKKSGVLKDEDWTRVSAELLSARDY